MKRTASPAPEQDPSGQAPGRTRRPTCLPASLPWCCALPGFRYVGVGVCVRRPRCASRPAHAKPPSPPRTRPPPRPELRKRCVLWLVRRRSRGERVGWRTRCLRRTCHSRYLARGASGLCLSPLLLLRRSRTTRVRRPSGRLRAGSFADDHELDHGGAEDEQQQGGDDDRRTGAHGRSSYSPNGPKPRIVPARAPSAAAAESRTSDNATSPYESTSTTSSSRRASA